MGVREGTYLYPTNARQGSFRAQVLESSTLCVRDTQKDHVALFMIFHLPLWETHKCGHYISQIANM